MQFIGFNTAEGRLFSSAEARSAFSGGIQREMLADAFLSGHARAAQFPISPASALYPEDLEESYSYDATIAALTAAGQDTGVTRTLTMLVSEEDSFRVSCAQYISETCLCWTGRSPWWPCPGRSIWQPWRLGNSTSTAAR